MDQCLDSDKDGGVYTHNCHENLANPNMQWRVTVKKKDEGPTGGDRFERSDDWIQIQNVKSGRCLADNGADIVTQACDANDAWQYFNFAQATATKDPSFYVTTGHGFASMTYRNNPDDEITRQESDGVSFWEVLDPATGKMINGLEGSRS
ncbi:hypothetical protein ACFVZE_15170 [Streptomyces anulatus]|uniref:hypothetical protein n=1 Tax=Streptomyces anulatus TaxID=1892 RepID=UPI0036D953EB